MPIERSGWLLLPCMLLWSAAAGADDGAPDEASSGSGWKIEPEISLSEIYNDNIFATASAEESDFITVAAPKLAVESDWQRHRATFNAGAEIGRYRDNSTEDFEDYEADLDGRFDLTDDTRIFAGIGYRSEHEDRDSPDALRSGDEPTTFDTVNANVGLSHLAGAYRLQLGSTYESLEYDNVPAGSGQLINDDRDRAITGVGMRLGRRWSADFGLFLQGLYDWRRYDKAVDINGFDRDSEGYRVAAGLEGTLNKVAKYEFYLGYLNQDYSDARFSEVSSLDMAARVTVQPDRRSRLRITLDRALQETTLVGASGLLITDLDLSYVRALGKRWSLDASASYSLEDYQDVDREDDVYGAGLGLSFKLHERIGLSAGYRYLNRDSEAASEDDFEINRVFVSINGRF